MISVENVRHSYGKGGRTVEALKGVSTSFGAGTTALLGPNGSGKSTLMNIIGTTIVPTEGRLFLNGVLVGRSSLEEYRSQLGVVPQHIDLPKRMRVCDVLSYLCWVHGVPKASAASVIDSVLERLELADKRGSRVGDLSGGQLRRVGFACAMVHQPSVLLLDEPTVGLDPEVRLEIRHLIARLATNATVVLSTHLLEDVSFLNPAVVMINAGEKVFEGSFEQFVAALPAGGDVRESSVEQAYQQMLRGGAASHQGPLAGESWSEQR
ncbi:ATP-binding cassette domain-containing protein [Corynebacterium lizhenjunii]|uniref:ATP-binding cassette domain-containing protein n=1 Tax=Corynebacterium lizhenjunii TaxID=2709394 RepID=A0A7T0KDI6_9CORY|nr:ATP-binding cassette domain-containing protein [Corynebacterium lizhenjunii]QPK78800.1 ATP-binding cassette domain-containing protein [Corynebacterium lizhenjunii]